MQYVLFSTSLNELKKTLHINHLHTTRYTSLLFLGR